jgi:hypothetical protein
MLKFIQGSKQAATQQHDGVARGVQPAHDVQLVAVCCVLPLQLDCLCSTQRKLTSRRILVDAELVRVAFFCVADGHTLEYPAPCHQNDQ